MKYLIQHSHDDDGTVIDGDTLHRFIDTVRAADRGDLDAAEVSFPLCVYVAERLAELVEYDEFMARDRS